MLPKESQINFSLAFLAFRKRKGIYKKECIYICMVESLCCTAESNTTLYVNYMSIKKSKLKKKYKEKKMHTIIINAALSFQPRPGARCLPSRVHRPGWGKQAVKRQQRFSVGRRSSEVAGQPLAVSPTSQPAHLSLVHSTTALASVLFHRQASITHSRF